MTREYCPAVTGFSDEPFAPPARISLPSSRSPIAASVIAVLDSILMLCVDAILLSVLSYTSRSEIVIKLESVKSAIVFSLYLPDFGFEMD